MAEAADGTVFQRLLHNQNFKTVVLLMTSFREISPVDRPVQGTVRPPGSKSITNRALVLAALADGTSTLTGVLDSQDTQVMIDSLRRLGIEVVHDADRQTCTVSGC